jgi:hypothetical protein
MAKVISMELALIVAIIIAAPVLILAAASLWYLNCLECKYDAGQKVRAIRTSLQAILRTMTKT